jgi:sterol desaturase/sphingolipid hydroxylase (fatty acid hydroxylase superfamily)
MRLPLLHQIHWPHLFLLAALPVYFACLRGYQASLVLFAWLLFNALLLLLAERWRPWRADWHWRKVDGARDGGVFALNVIVDGVAAAAVATIAIALDLHRAALPLLIELPLALVIAEFGSYWMHRLSHRGGWLWRVHLLHHCPERLNAGNALTAHPLNAFYDKLARTLPLLALGFGDDVLLLATLFALTQSLVTHANIAGTIGPLNYLVGSAELHRLHHSTTEDDAGNFGTALPVWDQLFGTFRFGHAPDNVGVFDPSHYPGEHDVGALLRWPFTR